MSDLLFTVNAVMPIISMVLIGYLAKRLGIIKREIAGGMNKLVFRLLLPIMLFLNVYRIEGFSDIGISYILYVLAVELVLFAIGVAAAIAVTKDPKKRGVINQVAFRSNYALVGIPLATSLFGDAGGMVATVLSVALIPMINVLAVISLTSYTDGEGAKFNVKRVLIGIIKNPLIQSIALGGVALLIRLLFVKLNISFRLSDISWLYDGVLNKLSSVATPLALIALGADFEFSRIGEMKKEILTGVMLRCVLSPLIGLGIALALGAFEGAHFAAFVAAFAPPLAVSSVPMTESMGSDHKLAGQLVVWTTLTSALTLFLTVYILRVIGIF